MVGDHPWTAWPFDFCFRLDENGTARQAKERRTGNPVSPGGLTPRGKQRRLYSINEAARGQFIALGRNTVDSAGADFFL
jgi:hypothetical protein